MALPFETHCFVARLGKWAAESAAEKLSFGGVFHHAALPLHMQAGRKAMAKRRDKATDTNANEVVHYCCRAEHFVVLGRDNLI